MNRFQSQLLLGTYLISAFFFLAWSYALTDPNLVLTSFAPYWNLQQWLWQNIWQKPDVLSMSYLLIILSWFFSYALLVRSVLTDKHPMPKSYIQVLVLAICTSFLAYNALSHDVFNYIFNAKMVVEYRQDPHVHTAIEFPNDLWTRFMHNTHTPAPYGYGWTALSVLPFFITQRWFTFSWLVFKSLNLVAMLLLWQVLKKLNAEVLHYSPQEFEKNLFILFANPLLLIELLANAHNDLWMLVPALCAILMVFRLRKRFELLHLFIAIASYAFSLTTKWATVALIPVLGVILVWPYLKSVVQKTLAQLSNFIEQASLNWPITASMLMFLPLFTDRSQQFHPWYLLWSLVWLPLMKKGSWFSLLLLFSFSSMLRYLPWLYVGGYSPQVLLNQKIVTWGIPFLWLIMNFAYAKITSKK